MKFLCLIAFCGGVASITSFNSCTKQQPIVFTDTTHTVAGKTWLALGDSYTIGQSVADTLRFPAQTEKLLSVNGIVMQNPLYIATTGWTTLDLQSGIKGYLLNNNYDVVSLLIGVNDQYHGWDTIDYRAHFTQLLQTSISQAAGKNSHVVVVSIPDYSITPFASGSDTAHIRMQIDEFNAINKQVTLQYQCNYVDITPASRQAKNNPSLIASDGLHPSGLEYKVWADSLLPVMLNFLK
jgi:lysophospholipase L1-like esterase